jgi:hypothetical protein
MPAARFQLRQIGLRRASAMVKRALACTRLIDFCLHGRQVAFHPE